MRFRIAAPFALLMVVSGLLIFRLAGLTEKAGLAAAAQNQSHYSMTVAQTRGTIYDCRMTPLTNASTEEKAIAVATPEAVAAVGRYFSGAQAEGIRQRLRSGKPVLLEWAAGRSAVTGLLPLTVPVYQSAELLAVHVVGTRGDDGGGISGIEAAFDSYLQRCGGAITASYSADALGRALSGEEVSLHMPQSSYRSGVVLTIDARVQRIAEKAAASLKAGAVVIMEVGTGKLRALVSVPDFDPADVASAMNAGNSPLLNRAFCAYNVGSVFKLVVACAAQEDGADIGTIECTGTLDYAGRTFQCIGAFAHGQTDLCRAVAFSCNCYFIRLAEQTGAASVLRMAQQLGFGQPVTLAEGMTAAAGTLPSAENLSAPAALANLSFGQGELLATPVQIAAMVQTIANGGVFMQPTLVEGLYNAETDRLAPEQAPESRRVMQLETALTVRKAMIDAVEEGTVRGGKPENGTAGAKTATAETGWSVDGVEMIQAWCAGFYPAVYPRYAIAILAENGRSGSGVCAPVFKAVTEGLASLS